MLKQRKAVWAGWRFTVTGYPPIRWQGCSPVPSLIPLGFPGGSVVKESTCQWGDPGSIPGLGRPPGGGLGNPLQYSCLENPTDGGVWWVTVQGIANSQTRSVTKQQRGHFQPEEVPLPSRPLAGEQFTLTAWGGERGVLPASSGQEAEKLRNILWSTRQSPPRQRTSGRRKWALLRLRNADVEDWNQGPWVTDPA